jgi:hypothetical protein
MLRGRGMKNPGRGTPFLARFALVALAACGSSQGAPAQGAADAADGAFADAGSDARAETDAQTEAGGDSAVDSGRFDAGRFDGGRLDAGGLDAGPIDAGPVDCPTSPTARTVGAHRSALPAMTWWGAGYTVILDEVVTEQTFTTNLTFEKTDATGALLAGPSPILPDDGVSRLWPRVAFSGSEYGIAYLEDVGRRPTFLRTDASLAPIAGSKLALGNAGATVGSVAVGWSNQTWAVAWNEGPASGPITLYVQRFDPSGAPLALPQNVGPGTITDNGVPMIPTAAGWTIVTTGSPARLYEIDAQGTVRELDLPFGAARDSVAYSGTLYAVVGDTLGATGTSPGTFALVQVGGGVVPGSVATLGGNYASLPNAVWTGTEFVLSWSETYAGAPEPLLLATATPGSNVGAIYGAPYTTQTNAGFAQLAAGSCGWGVVYGTFTPGSFDELEVRP